MREQLLPVGKFKKNKIPSNGLEFLGFVREEEKKMKTIPNSIPSVANSIPKTIPSSIPIIPQNSIPVELLPFPSWKTKLTLKTTKLRKHLYSFRKHSLTIKTLQELLKLRVDAITSLERRNVFMLLKRISEYFEFLDVKGISNDSKSLSTRDTTNGTTRDNNQEPLPLLNLLKWTFYLLVYADTLVTPDETFELRVLCKRIRKLRFDYIQESGLQVADEIVMGMTVVVHLVTSDFGQRDLQDLSRPLPLGS